MLYCVVLCCVGSHYVLSAFYLNRGDVEYCFKGKKG